MNDSHRARLALALALLTAGCPGPEGATLTITDPTTGSTLGAADDTDPGTAGVQIDVAASSDNLSSGTAVDLLVDGASVASATVDAAGGLAWEGVSLANGTHTLVAVTREGGIRSADVVVVVDDSCFSITFVEPEATGDAVRLTSADDTDGEACGATFETSVVVATSAPDGSQAQIFVNATPRASTPVTAGVARFTGVALDNRGSTSANTIRVVVTDAAGLGCGADFPLPVFVECEGPSCAITSPDTGTAFLSSNDDTSAADGFQTDFEVTTDTGVQGRLIIDGDVDGAMSAAFTGGTATYGNVSLTEATHRVVAECTDALGNTTRSGAAEWTVDITECGIDLDSPMDGATFATSDDVDPGTAGTQIEMTGTAGADCSGLRVGACTGIDAGPFGPVDTAWTEQATLASATMQELCAQTRDDAGNVSEARVDVRFAGDGPALEIGAPAPNTRFNQASDATPGDSTCAQDVEVYCDAPGEMVELYRVDTATLIDSAPCMADASVPSPYLGRAAFAEVVLPNREDGSSYAIEARATVGGVEGTSAPVSIFVDCNAPGLSVLRPLCGQTLNPTTQDEDPAAPGFQYRTTVTNSDPASNVTLTIGPSGGAPVYTSTDTSGAGVVNFAGASYGAGGLLDIVATATDGAGNVGTSPACSVTVMDLPSVVIDRPSMGAVLSAADDCGGADMRVTVSGTTDAPDRSAVVVRAGTLVTNGRVSATGTFNVCARVPEGPMVSITVEITDARGTGSATVVVAVDTSAPTGAIGPVTATVIDRRAGVVRFEWTAVADGAGSTPLSAYEMRCSAAPITTEMEWMDARAVPIATVPGTPGTVEREDVDAFRPGEDLSCALRGSDAGGNLTPLGSNVTVSIAFSTHAIDGAGTTGLGDEIAAVGDVNGDMIDDVLTGGEGRTAYLWYGSSGGLSSAPDVVFTSSATGFGNEVVGLGDFNADGRNDFAIAAPNAVSNQGQVFVFFGRSAASPLPAACNVDLATCRPDLTFGRPAGLAVLGSAMSSSDFDGDGVNDLVVAAPALSAFTGEVYVVRGGAHLASGSTFELAAGSAMAPLGFVISPPAGVSAFGNTVAGLGASVVGDARHDLVIAAPGSSAMPMANIVLVEGRAHSGSGLAAVPASALTVFDTDIQGRFSIVAPVGDVNGDGSIDVAAYSPVGGSAGRVDVYLGGMGGFSATRLFAVNNDVGTGRDNDTFGLSLGAGRHPFLGNLGDLDRDMIGDLLLGSSQNGTTAHGSACVFYGLAPAVERNRTEATPELQGSNGIRRVGFIGDVDGDGFNDFGIGEAAANGGAGRLTIVH